MIILAVETTGDLCSVAVRDSTGTLIERVFRHRMRLSERLIGDIESALSDAGITLADVGGLAVGVGPGSFTGVRLGVMTVKAWADVLKKPVVGVNTLDALAEEASASWRGTLIPLIRARPGAVSAAAYDCSEGRAHVVSDVAMVTMEEAACLASDAEKSPVLFLGDGLPKVAEALKAELQRRGLDVAFGRTESPRASTLAAIAERRFSAGESDDALALVPLYISPPPIDPRAEIKTAPPLR